MLCFFFHRTIYACFYSLQSRRRWTVIGDNWTWRKYLLWRHRWNAFGRKSNFFWSFSEWWTVRYTFFEMNYLFIKIQIFFRWHRIAFSIKGNSITLILDCSKIITKSLLRESTSQLSTDGIISIGYQILNSGYYQVSNNNGNKIGSRNS